MVYKAGLRQRLWNGLWMQGSWATTSVATCDTNGKRIVIFNLSRGNRCEETFCVPPFMLGEVISPIAMRACYGLMFVIQAWSGFWVGFRLLGFLS